MIEKIGRPAMLEQLAEGELADKANLRHGMLSLSVEVLSHRKVRMESKNENLDN